MKKKKTEREQVQQRTLGFEMGKSEAWKWLYRQWEGRRGAPSKPWLIEIAETLANKTGLEVDRLMRRHKDVLVCWFDDNWATIQPILETMVLPVCPAPHVHLRNREASLVPLNFDCPPLLPGEPDVAKVEDETPLVLTTKSGECAPDSDANSNHQSIPGPSPPIDWENSELRLGGSGGHQDGHCFGDEILLDEPEATTDDDPSGWQRNATLGFGYQYWQGSWS